MSFPLKVFIYSILYIVIASYFEEYILARHLLYKSQCIIGKIVSFGKSKIFYASKAAREFYTIVEYVKNGEIYTTKISRDVKDEIGNQIVLAVGKKNKWCVRYKWCKPYNEHTGLYTMAEGIVLLSVSIIFEAIYGDIKDAFQILSVIADLHYLILSGYIRFRNDMWKQN